MEKAFRNSKKFFLFFLFVCVCVCVWGGGGGGGGGGGSFLVLKTGEITKWRD